MRSEQLSRIAPTWGAICFLVASLLFGTLGEFSRCAAKPRGPISVGMVALLASPQKYDGKIIRTWGFLNLRPDDNAIFAHEEDCQIPLYKNSFGLDFTEAQERQFKSLNQTYVIIEGTMHSKGADGPALDSGTLVHITMVHGWKPFVPFDPDKK